MINTLDFIIGLYSHLLRLYPDLFRTEFEEQMLLDFSDMAGDAWKKGSLAFLLFCLHELLVLPANVMRAYLKEGGIVRIFRSRPANYGLRGAAGFAVTFFLAAFLEESIYWKMNSYSDAIAEFLFYTFLMALRAAIFEIPLGIFVGIALAVQKKNASMKLSMSG